LGSAKIRHPFHPLRGQSFLILNKLRIAGVDTLVVRGAEGSNFQVAREWTDHGDPYPYEMLLDVSPLPFTLSQFPSCTEAIAWEVEWLNAAGKTLRNAL
jgi:hypothetical protein